MPPYVRGYQWASLLLAWLGASQWPALALWLDTRHDAALEPEFAAIYEAVARRAFADALRRAQTLSRRIRLPQGKARALTSVADVALMDDQPEVALDVLAAFPREWRLPAPLEVAVLVANGRAMEAVDSMRGRLEEKREPAVIRAFVTALVAAGQLDEALRVALGAPRDIERPGMLAVETRLFRGERFEDCLRVASAAFESFGVPDDAYNAACSCARLGRLDDAASWLSRAVEAGYADRAHLEADEDLAPLRGREDFDAMCAGVPRRDGAAPPED
ncbi:MAG: hypothetical protein WCJ30_14945 [Deltaproteobacteria bacterium]